jgi:hypothetical protein
MVDNTIGNTIDKNLELVLQEVFKSKIPTLIDKTMSIYKDLLLSTVVAKESLSNPLYMYDDFKDRLKDFNYVYTNNQGPTLEIPSVETFDFSGSLVILKFIMEGISGFYYELPETDLNTVVKNNYLDGTTEAILLNLPGLVSDDVPVTRSFRLVPAKSNLAKKIKEVLNKELVIYPFSNQPPIDIFYDLNLFTDSNIKNWIDTAIDTTLGERV